jgi:hypothetical protein
VCEICGFWNIVGWVCGAGALGGFANALITDKGLLFPGRDTIDGWRLFRLGFFGNLFLGALAALISWGLYGPLGSVVIAPALSSPDGLKFELNLIGLVGCVLIGLAGVRWLTQEVDRILLGKYAKANRNLREAINLMVPKLALSPEVQEQVKKGPAEKVLAVMKQQAH